MRYLALLLALLITPVQAQQTVRQGGGVTPGHVPMWVAPGVLQDGGTAVQGFLSSLGVTQGSGFGICVNSASIEQPYNRLCLSSTMTGGGVISLDHIGIGAVGSLNMTVNGGSSFGINDAGHLQLIQPVPPAVSGCGTAAAIGAGSTDTAGVVLIGTNPTTSCTITFSNSYAGIPACVVSGQDPATGVVTGVPSMTGIVFTYTSASAVNLNWVCGAAAP